MTNFINDLMSNINGTSLFNTILPIVSLVILFFVIAFGLNILRDFITTRKINKFIDAGGLHTDDERIRRWVDDL